jgi:hypothetical protein
MHIGALTYSREPAIPENYLDVQDSTVPVFTGHVKKSYLQEQYPNHRQGILDFMI